MFISIVPFFVSGFISDEDCRPETVTVPVVLGDAFYGWIVSMGQKVFDIYENYSGDHNAILYMKPWHGVLLAKLHDIFKDV